MTDRIEEILEELVGIEKDFSKCKCNYDGVFHPTQGCLLHGEEAFAKGKKIVKARSLLLKEMLEMVGKDKEEVETCTSCGGLGFVPNFPHRVSNICSRCNGHKKIIRKDYQGYNQRGKEIRMELGRRMGNV